MISAYVRDIANTALAAYASQTPWYLTTNAPDIVRQLMKACGDGYALHGDAMIHRSAIIEPGAQLKGPTLIGPNCFVASSALLRGGCFLDHDCILGPGVELKSSFMFAGSKAAHLNFIGDSVIGADVNIEAGAMIANYRNERAEKRIRITAADGVMDTGVDKFGALVGDSVRIGANAVIAPGALLKPETIVARLALIDQASGV
ncbi:MAG: hypothetical protein K2P70_10195 [Hyphomonadaceae bacterium]|nr:hypothetical protein [Hyphomonadaceae bacterium]